MNDKILQIVIKARDEASGQLDKISSSLKKNEQSFKNMAMAGTVAIAGVTAVVATSVNAYAESERNQRQLEHAIIGVSKGTMEQVQAVNKITDALQKKAGIDGDALNAGVAQLSTFGLQSKSVIALTKSLADLTVNQNGVKAGTDAYITSANIMAKALNGEFGQLQKMGIRFTEHQRDLIKSGTEAQKVATIQEGLAQNLRETTDTVAGYDVELGKIKQSLGDVQEAIGKGLQPVLTQLSSILIPIIQQVSAWTSENPKLTTGILLAVGALGGLSVLLGTIGLALPVIIAGIGFLSVPLLTVVGIIAMATVAITALWNITQLLYDDSTLIFAGYKAMWQDFTDHVMARVDILTNFLKGAWKVIQDTTKIAMEAVVGYFTPFIDSIKSAYDWVTRLIDKMIQMKNSAMNNVGGLAGNMLGRATGGGVQAGNSYVVGERGAEIFTPSSHGSITPNYKLAGAGGAMNVNVTINGGMIDERVAENIGDLIINRFRKVSRF